MKITFVTSYARWYSMERWLAGFLGALPPVHSCEIVRIPKSKRRLVQLFDRYVKYPLRVRRCTGDVVLVGSESTSYLLPFLRHPIKVIICHDIHPLQSPHAPALSRRIYEFSVSFARSATFVVAVSHNTRRELLQHFSSLKSSNVIVAHNGVEDAFRPEGRQSAIQTRRNFAKAGERIVLNIGKDDWYKNLANLLRAIPLLREHNVRLVRVGPLAEKSKNLIKELGIGDSVFVVTSVSREKLVSLYSAADLLAFPSLHEGFGWPPLEAMACGCPVVGSPVASLLETCRGAFLEVDPFSPESIAKGITQILNSTSLRKLLLRKGFRCARKFRWDNTTNTILDEVRKRVGDAV